MNEQAKKQKQGGSISEEDVSVICQRYTATTVLALLQEVAQVEDVKIDWNALVKKTKTGITNPREYQMLWRHLAYRDVFLEKFEDDAKPLDDDSDLEYELEAFPTVSNEASAEAAACVKVLIASGSPSDPSLEKGLTIEAPLMINIPKGKPTSSVSGTNIAIPVSVPKQALPTASSAEALDTNGNLPPRRKRKQWSEAEDDELVAAVQKCGEGNWANILKGDFKGDRTASQLSQRWSIIKKRKMYSINKPNSQLSEVQLAARRALNLALDKPEPPDSALTGAKRSFHRAQPLLTRPLTTGPDAVKAAAVAAGARIATQSAAAAILKAQLKGAIHVKTGTGPGPGPGAHSGSDYLRELYSGVTPGAARANHGPEAKHLGPGPLELMGREDRVGLVAIKEEDQEEKPKNLESV